MAGSDSVSLHPEQDFGGARLSACLEMPLLGLVHWVGPGPQEDPGCAELSACSMAPMNVHFRPPGPAAAHVSSTNCDDCL